MKYNKYRNKYNNIIKMARKQYYHNKLTSISSSLRDTWSVIKSVISKKQSSQKPMVMKDSDGQYSNLEQMVQKFNNYFANVCSCLAKRIPQTNADSYKEQMTGTYNNNIFLSPTTANEICTIVSSLKSSKSEGWDGINILPIKATIDLLSCPLSKIYNISLSMGEFPDNLKIAKVLPIYKTDDASHFSNYRPISILPCLSKILEKVVYLRISDFLTKFNILNDHQYGFAHGWLSLNWWTKSIKVLKIMNSQ